MGLQNIDKGFVKEKLGQKGWIVLDTRSSSSFIGWRLEGEPNEGHIKGATDFSADWLRAGVPLHELEVEIYAKMVARDITADKNIILYDWSGNDAPEVAKYLEKKGIKNLYYYSTKFYTKIKLLTRTTVKLSAQKTRYSNDNIEVYSLSRLVMSRLVNPAKRATLNDSIVNEAITLPIIMARLIDLSVSHDFKLAK